MSKERGRNPMKKTGKAPAGARSSKSKPASGKPASGRGTGARPGSTKPVSAKPTGDATEEVKPARTGGPKKYGTRTGTPSFKRPAKAHMPKFDDKIRLNKYLANAGLCSRREADTLIESGVVTVNGQVITEMGYKVEPTDVVKFDGATVKNEKKRYVLVNKPVDFSLRYEEDHSKKSVYQLIKSASKEPLIPVGKLDKSAAGLVLYTNDTDLELKLTHPQVRVSQLFHLILNKEMSEEDLEKLTKGLFVDEKMFKAEDASFVKGKSHNEIGVKIFSSKSNMVKLMIGKLGYEIVKLDRVEYAGLTKKDLPRGHYRHLLEKEVGFLKMN